MKEVVCLAYQLRPYQQSAVQKLIDEIKAGFRKLILRAPTGAGKTIMAARVIHGCLNKGNRVLFLAHRTELINQCSEKLSSMDVYHGIIQGNRNPNISAKCHIASVASAVNRQLPEPDVIIIDEAHHARAASYEKIISRFPKAFLLGLTATPARTDGKGLGTLYDKIIDTISYTELIEQGYLVPFAIFEPTHIDFSGVSTCAGDFNKKEKQERLKKSKIYGDILFHWQDKARDRSTIVFAASVADSIRLRDDFRSIGVVAEHVDGKTKTEERERIFGNFRAGKVQVLCNVGVATEGTDLPIASCIVLANPTRSLVLHHQMVGRGLRIHPESSKENCIILDHVGNHLRLGWIDDEIEWTLDCKKKAKRKGDGTTAPTIRTCPECFFAMRGGSLKCERCGYVFPVIQRELKKEDAELREAVRKRPKTKSGHVAITVDRRDELGYYAEALMIAKERGYRPTWAAVRFKHVYGKYPRFTMEDVKIRIMELEFEYQYQQEVA